MIRLCMLARDEADQMHAVAQACEGLYDSWLVLVDDRTTDETEFAAYEWLAGDGECVRFRFETFAQARNELFASARMRTAPGDYLLLADPDSPPRGVLPGLMHDWYSCEWRMGQTTWHLPILVRAGLPCYYEGACHELLMGLSADGAVAEQIRVDVAIKPFNTERAELYLDLLLPDATTSSRSAFYLARTYAELGRRGEAIEAYLRCAQMPQELEQAYLCCLRAGELLAPLDVDLARVLWERAREKCPGRVETLYHLAWLANQCGDPERAAGYCAEAVQMPPSSDTLFVNRWAEREGVLLELGKALDAMGAGAEITRLEN